MPRITIVGVSIDVINKEELERSIIASVQAGRKAVYAYVNVHALNLSQKDENFRRFFNEADTVYCDGEGVRLGAWILGKKLPPRVALTYFIWDLCALCESTSASIYFLGASEDIVSRAVGVVKRKYPRLTIAGWHNGYFDKEGPESEQVIQRVNDARPDLLFVGFGMPSQEHWIQRNVDRLDAKVILPCGSMIDFTAGVKSLAPAWMADHGLEWVHRLIQEPARLWRRYLMGNPAFLLRVMAQWARDRG